MHRRFLPAAGATFAAALAFANLTPALAQSSEDKTPPAAAAATPAVTPAPTAAAPQPAAPQVDPLVAQVRELASAKGKSVSADRTAMAEFYANRTALVWVTADGLTPRAQHVMAEIAKADDWGLEARAFELPQVGDKSQAALADAEIKISLAVLKYARFARGGRLEPSQLSRNFDQRPTLREPKAVMEAVASTDTPGNYLRDLHPKHVQFDRLRQAMLKARAGGTSQPVEEKVDAVVTLPDGPTLKAGMDHPNVALLRQRLKVRTSPGTEQFFDQDVVDAVKAFQQKNGIQPTGSVSGRTRTALNSASGSAPRPTANAGSEVQRIIVNMERWRWMPEDMSEFHVWDNIPEFITRVVKQGQVIHQAKIVVGRPDTQTVLFSANMRYIVFGPEWGVPDSIKVKEILPYLRPSSDGGGLFGFGGGGTDTRVLQRHNLRVSFNGRPVDASQVDWSQVDIKRYTFIQPSGPTNVLGGIKFRFPNKHDIYMHDTPQRDLFEKSVRAFSHGCMRVQNPGRLAEVLLEEDKGWSAQHVRNLLAQGGNNEVTLTKQIPVHVSYFTMTVGDDGRLQTFGDIYGHDNRVSMALAGRQLPLEAPSIESASSDRPGKDRRPRNQPNSSNDFFAGLFGN
jgi:L,D-transpeptidase YcbB